MSQVQVLSSAYEDTMKIIRKKKFTNGIVYALETDDGYPVEVTDTFLPYYTKNAIGRKQNKLLSNDVGSRKERWMIGVSVMSGCPVGCKFCATAKLKKCRNLSSLEILDQIYFVLRNNNTLPSSCKEFKINYTRMGEPFLNINEVKRTIATINHIYPHSHHYISTIGIEGSDFSWIKDNISLQFSIHSLRDSYRNWLIPYKRKMSIRNIGEIRTKSDLKTTLNMTLVNNEDFDIKTMRKLFDPAYFFVKLSPINENTVSKENRLGAGIIKATNIV